MPDARRHSVDVPLSKALMTLKRVRSLRDPATISTSKFPMSANYANWDSASCSESILEFRNYGISDYQKNRFLSLDERKEENETDPESANSSRLQDPKLTTFNASSKKKVGGKSSGKPVIEKAINPYEDEANSYSDQNVVPGKLINATIPMKRTGHGSRKKLSSKVENIATRRIYSPSMSISEANTNKSSLGLSAFLNEDTNMANSNLSGCGLSSCWSRTPKFKDVNRYSDVEDQECPLLSYKEQTICLDSPRSLSHKYRPKSFDELAGQHVVSQSLINAISKGKISPIYLFHGPRGTGKTSMARVFAAALNCLSLESYRPCGFCRECTFLFSGRSRDVKELDGSKLNRKDRVKALLKSASIAPHSSSFRVFIIDECQYLQAEAWPTIFKILEEIPLRVVVIMVTSELDKVPHCSISQCQRYHFPKVKDADIVCRLQKICVEEVLDFEKEALDCIAAKSNGSLRDAETMLDQLSLLGKRITAPLAYELIGIVSDDELINLLNLALSSDTSNTVRRARELMSSKVDPMQLVSQLANLIMDVLSGRCQSRSSEVARNFFARYTSAEIGLQKLSHALKILSETEKQLRTSKNQATWLTVALLQFSSDECSFIDMDDPKAFLESGCLRDDGLCCATSPRASQRSSCSQNKLKYFDCDCSQKLEIVWTKAIEKCQTNSLKNFLLKQGKLSSIYVGKGTTGSSPSPAIAEIQFCSPYHVAKAEKSWKQIASSLQLVLGCNVEIRISFNPFNSKKSPTSKKQCFSFLSCSGRRQHMSESEIETPTRREGSVQSYSDDHGQYLSPAASQPPDSKPSHDALSIHSKDTVIIRDTKGNALCSTASMSENSTCSGAMKGYAGIPEGPKDAREDYHHFGNQESEHQPCCFPKALKLRRKLLSPDTSNTIRLGSEPTHTLQPSLLNKPPFQTCFCSKTNHTLCSRSDTHTTFSSGDEEMSKKKASDNSNFRCCDASKSSTKRTTYSLTNAR